MDIEISTDRGRLDRDLIYQYLSEDSYWAAGIARDVVERSLDNSLCFGVYLGDEQIGFARVVTDMARLAYLADVFILPDYRGRGYGKSLIQAVINHPDLQTLSRIVLFTRDAQTLYGPFGFENPADPSKVMILQLATTYRE